MNDKNKQIIKGILKMYVDSDLPEDMEKEVKSWLVSNSHTDKKEAVLWDIWNNIEIEETDQKKKKEAWKAISKRIGQEPPLVVNFRRKRILRIAAICIPGLLIIATYLSVDQLGKKTVHQAEVIYVRQNSIKTKDEVRHFFLIDGTEVWLNKQSELLYGEGRKVELKGEAFFKVRPMDGESFVVETGAVTVTVSGTSFNLLADPKEVNTVISLYEGSLDIKAGDDLFSVKAGEEWVINRELQTREKRYTSRTNPGWDREYITYKDVPLQDIFEDLEQIYSVEIEEECQDLLVDTLTLKFEKNIGIQEVMSLVSLLHGEIEYRFCQDTIYVSKKK